MSVPTIYDGFSSSSTSPLEPVESNHEELSSFSSDSDSFLPTFSDKDVREPIPSLRLTFSSTQQMLQTEKTSKINHLKEEAEPNVLDLKGVTIGEKRITINPLIKRDPVTQKQIEQTILKLLGATKEQKYVSGQLNHALAQMAADKSCARTFFNSAWETVLPTISEHKHINNALYLELIELLSYQSGVDVVRDLFKDHSEQFKGFAEIVISRWKKKQCLIQNLRYLTMLDLQEQTYDTMLRNTCFSSLLCTWHGNQLLYKELKGIIAYVEDNFKKAKLRDCIVDRGLIRQKLEKDPEFQKSKEKKQECIIDDTILKNSENFSHTLTPLLEYIYKISLPADCVELLKARRECVSEYLKRLNIYEKQKKMPAVMVGELLFLRIINPALINTYILGSSETKDLPEKRDLIFNLTKFLQKLSNRIPFDEEDKDPIVVKLSELYHAFSEKQRRFIRDHSCL